MKCGKRDLLLYAVTDRSWSEGTTLGAQVEEALRRLNPQFKQLAGHGLILDNHDFVFHGIPCLPSKNVSVSSKRGA